ncbi:M14 family metallopeptidase [Pedobacter africanus]|uniref:Zinc carboxypeptidase n=1 Tax=Pedobacter africanus TaxID=151894 RepID=A0A1W2BCR3_9SPHI|nr:M14 family metallopeptidase [Pedobacter africanus]SMC70624.1 Zinc carboxypeptidase [Pedobacter africanus]
MKHFLNLLLLLLFMNASAQHTPYELSGKKETATYPEVIRHYQLLEQAYPECKLLTYGNTDFGKPLSVFVLARDKVFDPVTVRKNNKCVLLINNGIHPGEPEGIDASMMLARDLLKAGKLPEDVVICIIPVYNIDGIFNRSGTSRANQNGPLAYGFRGNNRNYDLNRDFIKTDSQNSHSFQEIFNIWQPEIFVDTHTSNGADYQYTMTLIPTHKDKLNPGLSAYMTKTLLPDLYAGIKQRGYEMIPYVNSVEETPDAGITGFLESPRYSTGYTTLHNTIGFMPETHMLKAYDKRVDATYKLLETYLEIVTRDAKKLVENKHKADQETANQKEFTVEWKLDQEKQEALEFKGYTAKQKPSEVSGLERLYYDRAAPYTKTINYWNTYKPAVTLNKPIAYIIPQAWDKVIGLLKLNRVKMQRLTKDTAIPVEVYYIADYKTTAKPFEGHYVHSAVKVSPAKQTLQFYEGDYVVYVNQPVNRYIVETLEPQATDSFFNWNFFDSILGMKEHFSAYVFEDTAAGLLKKDPTLREKLEQHKQKDPALSKNAEAQLDFIYKNSDYYEKTHNRYPIARLLAETQLSLK